MAALTLRALDLLADALSRAISVADRFPNLTVRGVDLYPPPQSHVPPNCIFEVDDFTSEWYYIPSVSFGAGHSFYLYTEQLTNQEGPGPKNSTSSIYAS